MNLGTLAGKEGCDALLKVINSTLAEKGKAVVALAGLPGAGKTHVVKQFVRFGFGSIPRRDITVIDDNIIYTTRFWRLRWDKLPGDRTMIDGMVRASAAKVLFFSNWIPGRFIHSADVMVYLTADEKVRLARLQRRYRNEPEKFLVQKDKMTIPVEDSFRYRDSLTLVNDSRGITAWLILWMIKRVMPGVSGRKEGISD